MSFTNAVVTPIMGSPSWILTPFIAAIIYTGRRSAKTFTTPVMYFKRGDTATIRVESPDRKKWGRNFLDDGAPITPELPDGTLTGQATTCRHARSTTAPATPSTRT